ncbi:hypothetical protein AB0K93_26360 [Streptomyces sp. NPDC052676]|uniref:hypothetical protein n=1 Tax=Streptomyces sp. NPDC052676 TaxID=3154953 RepID=UPI0034496968
MGAQYYGADSENGDRIDDPSEDTLFMMISDLNDSDNTFVVVQPDEDDPVWFTSVAVPRLPRTANQAGQRLLKQGLDAALCL